MAETTVRVRLADLRQGGRAPPGSRRSARPHGQRRKFDEQVAQVPGISDETVKSRLRRPIGGLFGSEACWYEGWGRSPHRLLRWARGRGSRWV